MNTIQQIAGAIGTAVAISLISVGNHAFMETAIDPTNPVNDSLALIAGVQTSFVFAFVVALVGLPLAFFIKRVQVGNHHPNRWRGNGCYCLMRTFGRMPAKMDFIDFIDMESI
ncbi:hypothetical protein [Paenibacillus amylolyticus]|uniref:hypothetical protein n=1 Tax=Paenibacillus amylolyticus TaxID=1451 RepID=UPI0039B0B1CE